MSPVFRDQYGTLRDTGKTFRKAARSATVLLWLAGFYSFLTTVRPLLPDAPANLTWGERRVMGVVAIVTLGSFGLAGWVVGKLLRAGADLIEVFVDGADAAVRSAYLIEAQLVPSLNRAAAAMERLVESSSIAELETRLDAARASDDVGRVIDCRDALTQHLRGQALHDLDQRVVRWVASRIKGRAKLGPVTPELAGLAERAGESFGDTPDGAALLAAVPELRRLAGLSETNTTTTTSRQTSRSKAGGAIPKGQP